MTCSAPTEIASVELDGPAPDGEEAREAVVDEVELRRANAELRGDLVGARAQHGILRERERSRAEHAEQRAISVPVHGRRGEQRAEREQECRRDSADQPAQTAERRRERPRPDANAFRRFSATARATRYDSPVSSSMNPRGGQSGSGASQRLEQCSDATF